MDPLSILLLALAILVFAIPVLFFLAPVLLAMFLVSCMVGAAVGVFLLLGLWAVISWPFKAVYGLFHD